MFLFSLLFAQNETDTLNQLDNQGKKHGYWEKSDGDTIKYIGSFDHGIPIGEFIYYYSSQNIKAKTYYSENGNIAQATMFFATGTKMAEGKFVNKKREGMWTNYDGHDNIIAEVNYKNGLKSGLCTYYYSEGGKLEEIIFENGLENGLYIQYFLNQTIKMKGFYDQGKFNGTFAFYHPNSQVYNTGEYLQNLRHGDWIMYDEQGKPIVKVTYKYGKVSEREVYQKEKDPEYINKKLSEEENEKKGTGSTDNGINDPKYEGY